MDPKLICYAYVGGTREFVSAIEADYDPMDEDNILWPANTTRVKPPAYGDHQIPVFDVNGKVWTIMPDYRGEIWYDPSGTPIMVMQSGDPGTFYPPLTDTPPVIEPPPPTEGEENYAKRTSKVAFFRRCTDAEAAQFVADLTDASPRLKAIFDSVTYLIPGTEEYPQLRTAVEFRVGADRANELLAPSND